MRAFIPEVSIFHKNKHCIMETESDRKSLKGNKDRQRNSFKLLYVCVKVIQVSALQITREIDRPIDRQTPGLGKCINSRTNEAKFPIAPLGTCGERDLSFSGLLINVYT